MALDNFRTIELIWDKANKSIIKTIKTASSDTTGRYLSVKVLDGGQEVTLNNAKLQLYWEHPNFNTSGTDDFTVVDNKGKFTLTFSDEMLTNVGELNAYLILTLSDGKITSDGFPIEVFKGADGGVVVPTNGSGLVKQIEGKIDKGNVTLNDLTQEVKLAMTGGSVAVVGENAVGTENIKDNSVTSEKTKFILPSKNLLIIEKTNAGKMWGGNASNDVVLTDNINITGSEPIPLKSGATHIYKNKVGGAIFADEKNKLVQFNGMSTPAGALEIPSGAKKVMLNIYNADVNTYQLEYGLNGTDYVRGSYGLDDTIKLNGENIENIKGSAIETGSVPLNKLELERSLNLFDRTNLQSGYIDRWTGGVTSDEVNKTSDYIPLSDNNIIFNKITNNLNIAYYNSSGVFIAGEQVVAPKTNAIVTPPASSGYFRFSVNENDVRDLIVQYGNAITATRDYYLYPKGLALPSASSESNDFNQLNIKSTANSMGIYKKGTKKESNKWLRMGFDYFKDLPTNADGWGITTVDAVSMDGLGNFSTIFPVTIGGEWEMAIMIDAAPDFIGLRQHGSEIMTSIKFYRDGISFIPKTEEFYCNELKVIQKTKMFDPTNETSHVANHIKEYIWTTENLTLNHKIEWLSSHTIGNSYLTMMPVTRGNDAVTSVQVTDTYYDNNTYDEWDVSNSGFETYPNLREVKGSKIYLYGKDSGVSVSAESVRNKPTGRSFVQNTPNGYNKIYFFMTETSVSAGDVTTGTSVYEYTINT